MTKGFTHIKMKVGRDLADDIRRLADAPRGDGSGSQADDRCQPGLGGRPGDRHGSKALAFQALFIEEPTSPDDVAGHRHSRGDRAHEGGDRRNVQNRIVFKQLIMRGAIDVVQIDACRMGGVNEVLAVLLMAAKYGLPVWPHAGGVGLCEYVQHLSMIDYLAVGGTKTGPRDRVCGPSARALRRSLCHPQRGLHAAAARRAIRSR